MILGFMDIYGTYHLSIIFKWGSCNCAAPRNRNATANAIFWTHSQVLKISSWPKNGQFPGAVFDVFFFGKLKVVAKKKHHFDQNLNGISMENLRVFPWDLFIGCPSRLEWYKVLPPYFHVKVGEHHPQGRIGIYLPLSTIKQGCFRSTPT